MVEAVKRLGTWLFSRSFTGWVLIVALVLGGVATALVVWKLSLQTWGERFIVGSAIGAWVFVLVCTLLLVIRAVLVSLYPKMQPAGSGDPQVEQLKGIVLCAGVAAGLGAGLMVGVEGLKHLPQNPTLYDYIIEP